MQNLARVFSLLLLLVVPACTHEEKEPLRVATLLWPGSEPIFLARDLGYIDDGSIRLVEYSTMQGGTHREFRNGMLDAAFVTFDIALQLQQQGFEPRVVLVVDYSEGADAIVARPGVKRLEDLRGKRVAVEDLVVSIYVLGRALELAGLQPSDIQILRIPVDQQLRAYESGQVDAVVTYEPFVGKLRAAGAHELFDSRQLPGEIVDMLVVRKDVLEEKPEQVEHLLQGWNHALRYLKERPADAVARMSPRLDTSPSELASMLDRLRLISLEENLSLLRGPSSPLIESARQLQRFMLKEGLLREPVRTEQMLDACPLEALQERR